MIVRSKKTKVIRILGKNIMPGNTHIPSDGNKIDEKIRNHQLFKDLERKGDFEVIRDTVVAKDAETGKEVSSIVEELAGLSAKDAKKVIKGIYNVQDLEAIIENGTRTSVINAAQTQLDSLMDTDDDSEE